METRSDGRLWSCSRIRGTRGAGMMTGTCYAQRIFRVLGLTFAAVTDVETALETEVTDTAIGAERGKDILIHRVFQY
jgi:hypothetical protein